MEKTNWKILSFYLSLEQKRLMCQKANFKAKKEIRRDKAKSENNKRLKNHKNM